jgi:tripartite-type tricarboxylate transporter receptor subunit TctC
MTTSTCSTRRIFGQRALTLSAAALAALNLSIGSVLAQSYPAKTITLVVPFPPGGTTDVTARVVAAEMSKTLGQTIIIENKAGANGNIGSTAVARAAPDGYTLLATGIGSNAVNHGLYTNMAYDSRKDFAHITQMTSGPNVLVVNGDFPAKTFKEWVELVKAAPTPFNYASAGNGASGHMAMELLKTTAGLKIDHIPYKGGAPAFQDVMGNQVPFMFINQDLPLPHIKTGKMRVLAVASPERNPSYPDVPTIAESGFPGFAAVSWNGLAAPAGTPKDIIDKLYDAAVKAINDPAIKEKMLAQGFVPGGMKPEAMQAFVGAEMDKWTKVAKDAGAKVD